MFDVCNELGAVFFLPLLRPARYVHIGYSAEILPLHIDLAQSQVHRRQGYFTVPGSFELLVGTTSYTCMYPDVGRVISPKHHGPSPSKSFPIVTKADPTHTGHTFSFSSLTCQQPWGASGHGQRSGPLSSTSPMAMHNAFPHPPPLRLHIVGRREGYVFSRPLACLCCVQNKYPGYGKWSTWALS